jgi:hypothetical protein
MVVQIALAAGLTAVCCSAWETGERECRVLTYEHGV